MNTFSRLSLFTLVCLGLILVGNAADVHAQAAADEVTLEVSSADKVYDVGAPVEVTFAAAKNALPESGVTLTITSSANVSGVPSSAVTALGRVTVKGTAKSPGAGYIEAVWRFGQTTKIARARFTIRQVGHSPALIVVNSPSNKSKVKIGDTFTQTITIENRDNTPPRYPTLPLSAWQMDVVYNPLILEVVDVTEGDFLESDGVDALYAEMRSSGKISVSQARAGQMANASPPPSHVAKAPSPAGIALAPGDKGKLLTVTFKVLAVAEEALGIHNVRLQSDEDEDKNGTPDRISYSILVSDVIVTTQQSSAKEDVNQDGEVNILDLVVVAGSIGSVPPNPRADVNGDGFVNVLDLITIYESSDWAKSVTINEIGKDNEPALTAPSTSSHLNPATIQTWIDLAQVEDDGSAIFDLGIANLEVLLASRIPSET